MTAQTKAKNDMALNLSELAKVTGYGRSSLQAMHLPLICGKMRLRAFWRFIESRMLATGPNGNLPTSTFASPSITHSTQATADKFRAPRSKANRQPLGASNSAYKDEKLPRADKPCGIGRSNARPATSRRPSGSRPRNTE
jgi:hypothetical protein